MAPLTPTDWSLNKVDVEDISTRMGAFGEYVSTADGSRSGAEVPQQIATNVEFKLTQRYRGGKPRMYLPPGIASDVVNDDTWSDDFVSAVDSGIAAFFAAVTALSVGSMSTLTHIVLSYYHLFDNVADTSGRMRAVPRYRPDSPGALVLNVSGYATKSLLSSQRRRRTSTSP
jgi:hypothetical protein